MKRFILVALLLVGTASACASKTPRTPEPRCDELCLRTWYSEEECEEFAKRPPLPLSPPLAARAEHTSVPDPRTQGDFRSPEIADVKTCGCPKSATCGDCCGRDHCRCAPN